MTCKIMGLIQHVHRLMLNVQVLWSDKPSWSPWPMGFSLLLSMSILFPTIAWLRYIPLADGVVAASGAASEPTTGLAAAMTAGTAFNPAEWTDATLIDCFLTALEPSFVASTLDDLLHTVSLVVLSTTASALATEFFALDCRLPRLFFCKTTSSKSCS